MKRISIFFLTAACLVSSSCIKEKLESIYNQQEDQINKYIEAALKKDITYTSVNIDGANRLTFVQGTGEELNADGSITHDIYAVGAEVEGEALTTDVSGKPDLTLGKYYAITVEGLDDTTGWTLAPLFKANINE